MIHTTLTHLERYTALHPQMETACRALMAWAEQPFSPGVTELLGRQVYCNAFAYETHPPEAGQLEAHQVYLDVMYIKSGREVIAWCPRERLKTVTQTYDSGDDALLAQMQPDCSQLVLEQGDVAIFFPEDAHSPGISVDEPQRVEKLVVKVQL